MTKLNSYKELIVWQKAVDLAEAVYVLTRSFPKEEIYGLTSQMRRAAVAIPSNIAEGWARKSTKEYIQFLSVANGSAAELETQLILSQRLGYSKGEPYKRVARLLLEVQKLLPSIIKSLKTLAASP